MSRKDEEILPNSEGLYKTSKLAKKLGLASNQGLNHGIKHGIIKGYISFSTQGRYEFYIHEDDVETVKAKIAAGDLNAPVKYAYSKPEPFDPKKHAKMVEEYEKKMEEIREKKKEKAKEK